MPTSTSAKKRQRQSVERRLRNRSVRGALKTQVRKVREVLATGKPKVVTEEFRIAAKMADKAASKRVIHRNAAARIKSRLSVAIKAAKSKA